MAELRQVPRLAWYVELLSFALVGLGVLLLVLGLYVGEATRELSEAGEDVEGVRETLLSAAALLTLLGLALVGCGAGCWYLSHRIQGIMEEASGELRRLEVEEAASRAPPREA